MKMKNIPFCPNTTQVLELLRRPLDPPVSVILGSVLSWSID